MQDVGSRCVYEDFFPDWKDQTFLLYGVSDEHRKDRAPGPVRATLGY